MDRIIWFHSSAKLKCPFMPLNCICNYCYETLILNSRIWNDLIYLPHIACFGVKIEEKRKMSFCSLYETTFGPFFSYADLKHMTFDTCSVFLLLLFLFHLKKLLLPINLNICRIDFVRLLSHSTERKTYVFGITDYCS